MTASPRDDIARPHGQGRQPGRGIPDGLLVGALAFLLGVTLLTWLATGLSGWLAHGAWPQGVSFVRTPQALRALLTDPRDLSGAWPEAPAKQLSGYGLFWGILISQLMVLLTFAVLTLVSLARRRTQRAQRPHPRTDPTSRDSPHDPSAGTERALHQPPAAPVSVIAAATPQAVSSDSSPLGATQPAPPQDAPENRSTAATGASHPRPASAGSGLVYGSASSHVSLVTETVNAATGPVLLVTGNPVLWADTAHSRRALGPTHLYDPFHLTHAPSRLRWSPHQGCEDMDVARQRAVALLAPVRPRSLTETAVAEAAETLLRCCLHAAAVSGEPFRQVHRWSIGASMSEAVRTLRTHRAAVGGSAGELESVLIAHPERRDAAMRLIRRALSALSRLHVRNACTASRADALAMESFIAERGTLYVIGESIEDPLRGDPGTMPLLTALVSHVVEHGRRMAARSSSGRLDPPLSIVLDQIAVVAPLPELPSLLAEGEALGLPTLALLRTEEQTRTWWPTMPLTHRSPHSARTE